MIKKCSSCGYPVIDTMHTCPNCNSVVTEENKNMMTCPHCGIKVSSGEEICPECGEPLYEENYSETITPAVDEFTEKVTPVCTLCPIMRDGERKAAKRIFEDTGSGIMLARNNTMPAEQSINEDVQAGLFFYEGDWYIEERCEDRRSTFVHAGKAIKLAAGDIILMGDREFEFNIKMK